MHNTVIESLKKKGSGTTGKGVERAQAILSAAREIFATEGYAGLSMRSVAARVNVSLSTVQHYYQDKDTLVEAVLLYMMDDYRVAIEQLSETMVEQTKLERLIAAMDLFLAEVRRPDVAGVFMEIWSLANRNPVAAKILDRVRVREQKEFMRLIAGLTPHLSELDYELRAALMIAQIEGLTIQLSRQSFGHWTHEQLVLAARDALVRLATLPIN
ncbi:TetR/AcrR family transcriptional regulator [Aquirhabdus parva]|uniref:TetR family transcriptional regulator n=1 Tax=Aquirhabdus parva TaxID=2283318 RepID=A0A345P560_9GAMM|nr:TetR/AcrR family transcriptional regulator [Aquirhabdus parva]AXI02419.1 TetR family transcriptional regulator [Aquirhabdus parva]